MFLFQQTFTISFLPSTYVPTCSTSVLYDLCRLSAAFKMVKRKSKKQQAGKMEVDGEGIPFVVAQQSADLQGASVQLATPAPDANIPVAMDSDGGFCIQNCWLNIQF